MREARDGVNSPLRTFIGTPSPLLCDQDDDRPTENEMSETNEPQDFLGSINWKWILSNLFLDAVILFAIVHAVGSSGRMDIPIALGIAFAVHLAVRI